MLAISSDSCSLLDSRVQESGSLTLPMHTSSSELWSFLDSGVMELGSLTLLNMLLVIGVMVATGLRSTEVRIADVDNTLLSNDGLITGKAIKENNTIIRGNLVATGEVLTGMLQVAILVDFRLSALYFAPGPSFASFGCVTKRRALFRRRNKVFTDTFQFLLQARGFSPATLRRSAEALELQLHVFKLHLFSWRILRTGIMLLLSSRRVTRTKRFK